MSMKTVFLSSTARDLEEHREAAYRAIEGMDGYHCVRMEDFGARSDQSEELCREKVSKCDLLVGILGLLHGSCPEGSEQSFTELEYETAVGNKIPRLMFFTPKDFTLPEGLIEPADKQDKQKAFRERVNRELVRDTFSSPDDLARKVVQAIHNWERKQAIQVHHIADVHEEGVIPLPPQPCFAHPYPLQSNFTGRVDERKLLTHWLCEDDRPVLALVAIGGMGKSSLAWVWARRDVAGLEISGLPEESTEVQSDVRVPEEHEPEGLLWWSFYEGGGTFRGFLEVAIDYCSSGSKRAQDYLITVGEEQQTFDYASMQADLIQLLQRRRFLLVWDGAERLLREYGGLDAEVREEREAEELDPEARDIIEPAVERFLREMSAQSLSRLLLSSRLYPRVLEGLAGAREHNIEGLGEANAVAFLRARGIQGNRAELVSAARQYDFHPLSLSNLVAALLEDFEQEGDTAAAPRHDPTETLKARREHILSRAYERRAPHRRELVSRIAAMRGAIPKEVVSLLAEDIEGLQLEGLSRDLAELVRHGLLRHPSTDRYDFHPVVKRFCYQRLEDKQQTHSKLMGHFSKIQVAGQVESLEDLIPVIELYHHTVRAGQYDEAVGLLSSRLVPDPLHFRFGAFQIVLELVLKLFPDGEDQLPRLRYDDDKAWALLSLSNVYSAIGQPRRATRAIGLSIKLSSTLEDEDTLLTNLGMLGYNQIALGELESAFESLTRESGLPEGVRTVFHQAARCLFMSQLYCYRGNFEKASSELNSALKGFRDTGQEQGVYAVNIFKAYLALFEGKEDDAIKLIQQAKELMKKYKLIRRPIERDIILTDWLLGAALVALASKEINQQNEYLVRAETDLGKALARCRKINLISSEPDILLEWARLHRAKGDLKNAYKEATEAMNIADRCEYRLNQADIHNFLAQLALDAGDAETAKKQAKTAHERAWCDGPPHCYKPALDEAERLLAEIEGSL